MITLMQASNAVGGQLHNIDADAANSLMLDGVSINTRANCQQRLFVALKGDNFDAHDFLQQAQESGSVAVMYERHVTTDLPCVLVDDTHKALKDLASWWRSQFELPVIGITGSVGKTSVKEMLGSIFALLGDGVVTQGNLNNEIGVPLTLMRLSQDARYAVVEMGMNNAGEISRLTQIAKPSIAVINNAAAAHLEGLGSIEAVASAKGEIFEGLADDGVAVINNDDRFAVYWHELVANKRVVTFALHAKADVRGSYLTDGNALILSVCALGESFDVRLSALGEHSARNALAAIAASIAANISVGQIKQGLENYRPIAGRLNLNQVGDVLVIDDTYNASPLSMLAAIKVLTQYSDNTLLVGDMAELGEAAEQAHFQLGEVAAKHGVNRLLACGDFASTVIDGYLAQTSAAKQNARAFGTQSDLIDYVLGSGLTKGTVLIKGSRSAKMERVVDALTKFLQNAQATNRRNSEC